MTKDTTSNEAESKTDYDDTILSKKFGGEVVLRPPRKEGGPIRIREIEGQSVR